MRHKFYITLVAILMLSISLKAQTSESGESLSSQIKNNRVAGWQYAPPKVGNSIAKKNFEGSSLAKALREGTVEGMKFLFSPIPAATTGISNASPKLGFASEMSASEAKAARDKEPQPNVVQPNIPQEGQKE